jgi:hypothetical protein
VITLRHARALGYCRRGMREWAERNGFTQDEWSRFVRQGVDPEVLLRTGDAMAKKIVESANVR